MTEETKPDPLQPASDQHSRPDNGSPSSGLTARQIQRLLEAIQEINIDSDGQIAVPDLDKDNILSENLSLLISKAISGEDIVREHPELHRLLLNHPAITEDFLEALMIFEADQSESETDPEPLPAALFDLSFLKQNEPVKKLIRTGRESWQAIFEFSQATLQQLFELNFQADPIRDALDLAATRLAILRSTTPVEDLNFDIVLEAVLPLDQEDKLVPVLEVRERHGKPLPVHLTGTISWGGYQAEAPLDEQGMATFPPLHLSMIVDQEDQVQESLQVILKKD